MVALGLIDVRDLEEVGVGPLMEELGLDEPTAQKVVERCSAEAKIVAVEQEAKKSADATAKAADKAALLALGNAPAAVEPAAESAADASATSEKTPGALETASGGSPEVVVHEQSEQSDGDELSPEEQAVHGAVRENEQEPISDEAADEETATADLAEGRAIPPGRSGDEPR